MLVLIMSVISGIFNIRPLLLAIPKTCVVLGISPICCFYLKLKLLPVLWRERDVILVIWHRSVPHVVVCSFAEFLGTQNRQLDI